LDLDGCCCRRRCYCCLKPGSYLSLGISSHHARDVFTFPGLLVRLMSTKG
jgi:hypothetical protein